MVSSPGATAASRPPAAAGPPAQERVSRNAGFALATQLIGAIFTASLMVFLGRALSPDAYGLFAFAFSVTLLATLFADLGISASAARFMAERTDDRGAVAHVFRTAVRLKLLLAVAVAALLWLLAAPICDLFGSPGATWPLRGAAVALVGQTMLVLFFGAFAAIGRQRFGTLIALSESAVEVTACVGLVLAGAGAAGAAFGRAIGFTVGMVVGLALAVRVIGSPRTAGGARRRVASQRILRYAGPLLLVDAAFRVFSAIDVLLISVLLGGGAAVAAYELPIRLVTVLGYPAAAAASAVAPRVAHREAEGPDIELLGQALRYLVLLQGVFVAPLLVWPEAIVRLVFGPGYEDAAGVLRALAPFVFLAGVAQPVTLAVNYLGEARRRVPIALAMLATNVVIDVTLLRTLGVVAAGIGTSAAYLVWVPAHVWILHRRAGLPIRPHVESVVAALAAATAMAAALVLLGTGDVSLRTMAIGAVLGPAVYLAALTALGAVGPRDVAVLRGAVARTSSA